MPIQATQDYKDQNTLQKKQIIVVVKIDGLDDVFSSSQISDIMHVYGDGSSYGDTGLLYGGGVFDSVFSAGGIVRDYLSVDKSTLAISQKVEPEQGRASVSQFSLTFIDKDSYMTQLVSPGIILPEILGREVTVFLGYADLIYPTDFLTVFRGYVSGVTSIAGLVTLQLSDPNLKRRQQLFSDYTTTLSAGVDASVTTIPITSAGGLSGAPGLYMSVTAGNGDTSDVITYIQIDDEIISYDPANVSPNDTSLLGVTRGALGTTAILHDVAAPVAQIISLSDTAINLALQIMLSGWGGYWKTGVEIKNVGYIDGIGATPTKIQMPDGVDAADTYGLVEGDYITLDGSAYGPNIGNFLIVAMSDAVGYTNNVLTLETNIGGTPAFTSDLDTTGTGSLRSQYDVLPLNCGLKLTPKDVDVAGHVSLQQTWLSDPGYSYRFLITESDSSGKTFLESQIYLPIGCYSLTKRGQLSVGITRPPVGGAAVVTLDQDNVIDPEKIRETRALNNRKFFNQVQFQYDERLDGTFESSYITFDSASLSLIGFLNTLPITSRGGRTSLRTNDIFQNQANLLLGRYARGAQLIEMTVNYGAGNLIEAGDLVIVTDDGNLQVANFATGTRDLGTQYFEVENRTLNIKTGNVQLTLVSGIAAQTTDRFGIISPSSILAGIQDASQITISDSYGAIFPGNEPKKWKPYIGQLITIHSADYSVTGTTTLVSQDAINQYIMNLSPPLSFTPAAGYIVDIPDYPVSVDPLSSAMYKNTFAFADPRIGITGGSSGTVFTVASGDISKLFAGATILVHNSTFSILSDEVKVVSAVGTTVTVDTDLGFTPASGQYVELVGFSADGGAAYRFL